MSAMATTLLAQVGAATNRTLVLPVLMLAITHRCTSACRSCAWWRTPAEAAIRELTLARIDALAAEAAGLGTRLVVFTGGEPLVRADLCDAAACFTRRGMTAHLLTSGLGLARRAEAVGRAFAHVIVSLDAATPEAYRAIRGVDGFHHVAEGIAALRAVAPHVPVTVRTTLHAANFRDMSAIADAARRMGAGRVSFLAADVTGDAFGSRDAAGRAALTLSRAEVAEFAGVIEAFIASRADDIASGVVSESADRLRALPRHFAALNGDAPFPPKACNAPWVSAFVDAAGDVRPCFFHRVVGHVRDASLDTVVRGALPAFRATLDVSTDPVCARCVCSLKTTWRNSPWA